MEYREIRIDDVSGKPAWAFHLVPAEQADDWRRLMVNGVFAASPTVRINIDLYLYLSDTLRWIPVQEGSFDNLIPRPPVIDSSGAAVACRIFEAWRALYANAPDAVELCGGVCDESCGQQTTRVQKILICQSRDLRSLFGKLADLARTACDGKHLIYWSDLPPPQ